MDAAEFHAADLTQATADRRVHERLPCHAQLVVAWSHALDQRTRLEVVDIAENGMRVRSRLPILNGLTGVALCLLPENVTLNKAFRVQWVGGEDAREAGLMFVS